MNPIRRLKESKLHQTQAQTQDITSLWSSLGCIRTANWAAASETQGDLTSLSRAGRKVNRLATNRIDNGSTKHRPKQLGPSDDPLPIPLARLREPLHTRGDQNVLNEDSPKRVDFSRLHHLREVNWDGTYHDRLTFPPSSEGSDSTSNFIIPGSRDFSRIPNSASTATSVPNPSYSNGHEFTSPPFTPPPSISNSVTDFHLISPPTSVSQPSSSSSSASSLTFTEQPPDVRWAGVHKKTVKPPTLYPGKTGSGKTGRLKTTRVDIHVVNSRTGQPGPNMTEQHSTSQRTKGLSQTRRQIDEKWTSRGRAADKPGSDIGHPKSFQSRGVLVDMESGIGRLSHKTEDAGLDSPKLPVPFKMPITADLKDDRIMLRLKEKLKQQRALASSSGSSGNDSSLSCSSNSWAVHQFPATLQTKPALASDVSLRIEKPRKVAASHSSLVYRGFSEPTSEVTSSWRPTSKTGGAKKSGKPIKQPVLQTKKHDLETARQVAPPASPERPKKMTRLIAPGNKKSSKLGVTNIISASSWRAGQDLIIKELGPPANIKSRSAGHGDGHHGVRKAGTTTTTAETGDGIRHSQQQTGEADVGGEAAGRAKGGGPDKDKAVEEVMAHARVLSRDARSVLNEINQGSSEDTKQKSPPRPAMKRKAPKSADPEKHLQPSEKTRHYDQESVRKFMAKQKADRLKRQNEEKIASLKASERKQQILHDLTERQKQAAKLAAAVRVPEGDRKRKSDGRNRDSGELVRLDQDDNSTLTEDTGESTPRVVLAETEVDTGRQRKRSKDNEVGINTNQHALSVRAAPSSATLGAPRGSAVKLIEFRGQKMNVDVDNILHQFSQVMKQRQTQEPAPTTSNTINERSEGIIPSEFQLQGSGVIAGTRIPDNSEIAFSLGNTNSVARTNEERKQAIKATALTLQSRLAEERRKMAGVREESQGQHDTSGDFMSRHNRIAGDNRDFAVFTSDLPGSHAPLGTSSGSKRLDRAATQIQAAYRGHNVRQALNWELPGGQAFGHSLRSIQQNKQKSRPTEDDDDEGDDDAASELRDTSTFSEITTTEDETASPSNVSWNRRVHGNRHGTQTDTSVHGKALVAAYKPASPYTWVDSTPDPYSVMSVFSRQSRYLAAGSRQADMPSTATATSIITTTTTSTTTSGYGANFNFTSLKPVITSEQMSYNQPPIVARARYTRVEAVICESVDGHEQNDVSRDTETSLSEVSLAVPSKQSHAQRRSADLLSSDDDETGGSSRTRGFKSSLAPSYKHRDDGALRETDVSQMSRVDSRTVGSQPKSSTPHKPETQAAAQSKPTTSAVGDAYSQKEPSGRLSPNSLANKFSANLTYLESMEESLRHVIGMERTRSVALAQQETVSLAQILKSRHLEQDVHLQSLQLKAHREATDASQELDTLRARQDGKPRSAAPVLLENEANLRPEARSYSLSSRSSGWAAEGKKVHPGGSHEGASVSNTSPSIAQGSSFSRTAREDSFTSVKTDENLRNDLSSSSRAASQTGSIPEEVPEEEDSYSISFDESFSEVLPSESHRKAVRRRSEEFQSTSTQADISSHMTPYGDLSSLFSGGNSFNKFTADMVRQIMREEEYRAQHQAALLSLREKALKEKAKAELAWLQQLKQKPLNKAADDVFPNLDKRERSIRRNLHEQQAEIRRLQETNKIASRERQMLLQQHEEIAKLKQNTHQTLQKLQGKTPKEGRITRRSDVHTEDEMDKASDVSEYIKDAKSDSEVYRDTSPRRHHKRVKTNVQKQQKYRLDEKYMTVREQKLHERQKHAKELLEWKKRLDAEEQRVYRLEKKALEVWEGKNKKKDEMVVKKAPKVVAESRKDDSHLISDRMLSSMRDELDGPPAETTSRALKTSISEAISMQISGSKTDTTIDSNSAADVKEKSPVKVKDKEKPPSGVVGKEKSPLEVKNKERSPAEVKDDGTSPKTSGSEGSIPEEIPTGATGDKQAVDSSDDTLVNSSANDEYMDTFEPEGSTTVASRKKSSVGRLLLQGSSPLPTPWSHRTGSESESEESISHTETVSDVSDYEVRIRQLSDELRRRRKEIEILKKERSRRQKEKLKAQEEAMQKQLDVYNRYIQQLKVDKDELEHEPHPKTAVKPQIKQPRVGSHVKSKQTRRSEDASSSFEDMREGTDSNQTSPAVDGKGSTVSPVDGKDREKVSLKLVDRLLETTEPKSGRLGPSVEVKSTEKQDGNSEKTISSAVDENIEELSYSETDATDKTTSVILKIQTTPPAASANIFLSPPSNEVLRTASDKVLSKKPCLTPENESSFGMNFSVVPPSFTNDQRKISIAANDEQGADQKNTSLEISEDIEEQNSSKAQSVSSPIKSSNVKAGQKDVASAVVSTGIQESDSETESRINSYPISVKSEGSSRPSSERSMGSVSYSPGDDEEEDEDIISYGSDRMPPRPHSIPRGTASVTIEDISEHISASLPSISEKRQSHSALLSQESKEILESLLDYKDDDLNDDDADKTPVPTPREMISTPIEEDDDENASLLTTDPLADFCLGDRVLVAGRSLGFLRYKGKADFSPGIWAGVELDAKEGDSDGQHKGKRYFTCSAGHGVMVNGSDIVAASELPGVTGDKDAESPEESLASDQDESKIEDIVDKTADSPPSATPLHSTPTSSPYFGRIVAEKTDTSPIKKDITLVADRIVDDLTVSLVEDCLKTFRKIISKKIPPPTLPKPTSGTKHPPADAATTRSLLLQDHPSAHRATDTTADVVMKSMLEEAISDILRVKSSKTASARLNIHEFLSNGGESADQSTRLFLDDNEYDEKIQDNDSGLSLDAVQRPGSPLPGDSPSAKNRKLLSDDLTELFGEYIDDDLEFEPATVSSKPPPPYPTERSVAPPEEITPLVPHTREEIAPVLTRAVEIYWERRRFGESMEEVSVPPDFLSDVANDPSSEPLTSQSMASWKRMLFDLTGEIIRDIYKSDDKPDAPVWQKTKHKSQQFFHGVNPPTTIDGLQPIVQAAVFKLLGLNGNRKHNTINKWNIRKKKDLVDTILAQELGEEESGWVNYDDDELSLKMSLADSIFDSLVVDTVHTLNGIFQK